MSKTLAEWKQFFRSLLGHQCTLYLPADGPQCVDVAKDTEKWLFGSWQRRGHAKDWASISANDPHFKNVIASGIMQPGDLIVYDALSPGGYGHIGLYVGTRNGKPCMISQNGALKPPALWTQVAKLENIDQSRVIGILRAKG